MRSILVRVCRQNRFGTLRTGLGDWIAGMTPIRILEVPTVREQTHEGHPRWRASVGPGVGAPSRAGGTPHRLSSGFWFCERRVEEASGFEHGAGDVEEAVGDRAQGAAVRVAAASEFGVFGSASRVVLNGDAGPMVDGVEACRLTTTQLLPDRLV